jgi:hypothetical protein
MWVILRALALRLTLDQTVYANVGADSSKHSEERCANEHADKIRSKDHYVPSLRQGLVDFSSKPEIDEHNDEKRGHNKPRHHNDLEFTNASIERRMCRLSN